MDFYFTYSMNIELFFQKGESMLPENTGLDEVTVNGIPVSKLSEASQKLFYKIVDLKKECDELSKRFDQKQAAMKELGDLVAEEVELYKAKQVSSGEASSTSTNN